MYLNEPKTQNHDLHQLMLLELLMQIIYNR